MILKSAAELTELASRILAAAGASPDNARGVAEHLVLANLSGVDSHGVWHVKGYVEHIREGQLDPAARPEVVKETPTSVQVSGHWTFGHIAAAFAMERAIEKAAEKNVALAALVQSNHIGRLGHYVEMAAAKDMVAMVFLGGQGNENPTAVPFGGRAKLMHTNPLAMGFPGGEFPPMFFDYATTTVAGVKVVNAHRRQRELPPGCIVDAEGRPTTDPAEFFAGGGHVAFGGHKGYALMLAIDYLGRIVAGADHFVEENRGGLYDAHSGTLMVVFKADLFQSFAAYAAAADEMGQRVRNSPPAPGFAEVLAPGDLEERARRQRRRDGIPIEDDIWETLCEAAAAVGIEDI